MHRIPEEKPTKNIFPRFKCQKSEKPMGFSGATVDTEDRQRKPVKWQKEKFTLVRAMQDNGKITAKEIIAAEKEIVNSLQPAQFPGVIKNLQRGKKDEWVTKLGI